MNSCIYQGSVRHRRFAPISHEFRYALYMMYLDLQELPELFDRYWLWSSRRFAPAWFRRADYHGDSMIPLDQAVRDTVEQKTGKRPQGPIRLLTHLRYFGYVINPVSFYYCFNPEGTQVETILLEVTNTPWGERQSYVLDRSQNRMNHSKKLHVRFAKTLHVSPFIPMDVFHDCRFIHPGRQLVVHMEDFRQGSRFFDATLTLQRQEITQASLTSVLFNYPWMTAKVAGAIYWQALKLWWKKAPIHDHPQSSPRLLKEEGQP